MKLRMKPVSAGEHTGAPRGAARGGVVRLAAADPNERFQLASLVGNRALGRLLQAKLTVGSPGDKYEREADRVADQVMRMPARDEPVTGGTEAAAASRPGPVGAALGAGRPLAGSERAFFEPRFGTDFSGVRVHTGAHATELCRGLRASALTSGRDVAFADGQYAPRNTAGRRLLAHELTHVVQQEGTSKKIQRRLNVTGTQADVDDYLAALERVSGFNLAWLAPGPRVTIAGNTDFGTQSATARERLQRIINNPAQHAQLTIGTHQPRVAVGAHPGPGGGAQRIDIDDIRNLNTALPGQGDAKAFHEMVENFDANSAATLGLPAAARFGASHARGIDIESDVLEDSTIKGRRLRGGVAAVVIPAPAGQPTGPGIRYERSIQHFTHYNLELTRRRTIAGGVADFEIVTARRNVKTQVSRRVFTGFASGSQAVPAGAAPTLALVLADLNANPARTLLVEAYTDSSGVEADNLAMSRQRAVAIQAWFTGNGIAQNRIAIVGRGETNFVASNANAAGRRRNRRVVLTVHQ